MAEWEGKSKGTPLGYKIFIFFIKKTGVGTAYLLLYPVAAYYRLFSRKSSAAIKDYFKKLSAFSQKKIRSSIFKIYYNLGQVLIDKMAILSGIQTGFEVKCQGIEHLLKLDETRQGGFLIGAHLGNWEIATHYMESMQTPVNIVLIDQEHEAIKEVVDQTVGSRQVNLIPMKSDLSHIFKIYQAAKNKEFICIHGDRFMPGSRTLTASFLGEEARFPEGPFYLASKLGLPVYFVGGVKVSKKLYQLFCMDFVENIKEKQAILQGYVKVLEGLVVKHPHQWYNFYPFWS